MATVELKTDFTQSIQDAIDQSNTAQAQARPTRSLGQRIFSPTYITVSRNALAAG